MRSVSYFVLAAALAVADCSLLLGQTPDAAQVVTAARQALGGEKKLSAVRAFSGVGRTRQVRGSNLLPSEFEIVCELADRCVRRGEQDFARLTVGMFATSFSSFPLTFTYGGQAEAPDGKADVLDLTGPANFSARLLVHRETHLPVMLMWQEPVAQSKSTEYRMYYGDFREVDGLKLPFRIRRAVAGETVEETTFDRIRINPKIDPRRFEATR